jgi:flagellar assembly protein FliH
MKSPAKYLFDDDFAPVAAGKPSIGLVEHTQLLKQAEAAAYARGATAAEVAARTEAERRSALALERVASGIEALANTLDGIEARLATDAVEVAVAVGRKLAPELVAREPFAEIAALATECFRHLVATPHVVVRVSDSLLASARDGLADILRIHGLESRLIVLAEPEIAPGDCRIEWADGGIVRDAGSTAAAIDEAVGRYIRARLAAAPMPDNSRGADA